MRKHTLFTLLALFIGAVFAYGEEITDTFVTEYGHIGYELTSHPFDGDSCTIIAAAEDNTIWVQLTEPGVVSPILFVGVFADKAYLPFVLERVTVLMLINNEVVHVPGHGRADLESSGDFQMGFITEDLVLGSAESDVLVRFENGGNKIDFELPHELIVDVFRLFDEYCATE